MKNAIFWFRRDLRITDNAGLYHALKSCKSVTPVFIFDTNILDGLPADDARVGFIYDALSDLRDKFEALGSGIHVFHGDPLQVWAQLIEEFQPEAVFTNRDYEPAAIKRDTEVQSLLSKHDISFFDFKDQVVFDHSEVTKDNGQPYTVFTPYKNKWLQKLHSKGKFYFSSYPNEKYLSHLSKQSAISWINLIDLGFVKSNQDIPPQTISQKIIREYDQTRDFPGLDATSKLGIHFRFGTISIRQKLAAALKLNEVYVSELIWRDFYSMILYHFPQVVTQAFKPEYDKIQWRNDETEFAAWCEGRTGYPLVDAGMRQLNETGYMHNRVRMLTASFLTKHLLIDWRWGEAYFASKLLDYDLASNNGGWQWAAGCGTDAAPYFRIFNPETQLNRFDPEGSYISKWLGKDKSTYPGPIVDHTFARERCLATYKKALNPAT